MPARFHPAVVSMELRERQSCCLLDAYFTCGWNSFEPDNEEKNHRVRRFCKCCAFVESYAPLQRLRYDEFGKID
eukprot:scaffold22222_cov20-Prasinocladus_malaysianus.AAC.2